MGARVKQPMTKGAGVQRSGLVVFAALLLSGGAYAQGIGALEGTSVAEPIEQSVEAFGVDTSVLAMNPWELSGYEADDDGYLSAIGVERYCTTLCTLVAPINLATGTLITAIQVEGVDTNPSSAVNCGIYECPFGMAGCQLIESATSGATFDGGDFTAFVVLATPYTVDNLGNTYALQCGLPSSSHTRIRGIRIVWRRQVSPAPAAATFGDVPTGHWAFRFVEALAASGITGGCGGGNYCPDNPVTRASMAVFLATALGLHWPD